MNAPAPRRPWRPIALLVLSAGLVGCASTAAPVVYQSPKTPPTKAQSLAQDLEACRRSADAAVGLNGTKSPKVASTVGKRGAVEFADKAVESLVIGSRNAWERARGAGAGAMSGALVAVLLNWNEPDGVYRQYVDLCLRERGHRVLGWR